MEKIRKLTASLKKSDLYQALFTLFSELAYAGA